MIPRSLQPARQSRQQAAPTQHAPSIAVSRRAALAATLAPLIAAALQPPRPARAAPATAAVDAANADDEARAFAAYADRDFEGAERALTRLIEGGERSAGDRARLLEMRGAAYVDDKRFPEALRDYDGALDAQGEASSSSLSSPSTPSPYDRAYAPPTARARLLAGRALAREGVSDWRGALEDLEEAARLAAADGAKPDPYVVNSIGNNLASLGRWREAREAYLEAAGLFQGAKGFRGRGGSTTARLDGAVFAASNAALALAQLGDERGATKEVERVARRAPGSADMRAALAALYWAEGRRADAEGSWEFACANITVGCSRYRDREWLLTVRRWPPVMVERMGQFLAMS